MNVEELEKSRLIIYKYIAGSHAYGMATSQSDTDIRGVFMLPTDSHLSLTNPPQEISNDSQDIKYFELRKFINLAADNNPNVIEAFWMPSETVVYKSPVMDYLISQRQHFLSKKAIVTHLSYALGQIEKATGRNKLVNNPKSEERPKKEEFCYFIHCKKPECCNIEMDSKLASMLTFNPDQKSWTIVNTHEHLYEDEYFYDFAARIRNSPYRPVPVKELNIDLSKFHAASLEHVPYTYRLYYYGDVGAKGVFRGDDAIVTESIPLNDEYPRFVGLLVYNQADYERAVTEWKQYWDWVKNRNENRWKLQEDGKLDYDVKNMAHSFRLAFLGEHIAKHGEILVRPHAEQLEFLKAIRRGEYSYEFLINEINKKTADLKKLKELSTLPYECNKEKINEIYKTCYTII